MISISLKGISKQTIVQVFYKNMLISKKQNNIRIEYYVNCYVYFSCILLLTSFLGY